MVKVSEHCKEVNSITGAKLNTINNNKNILKDKKLSVNIFAQRDTMLSKQELREYREQVSIDYT